jgi:hypothetical protein
MSFLLLVSLKRGGGSGSTEDPAHIPQSPVQHVALQGRAGESERMEIKNSKGRRLSTIERLVDTHDASAVQRLRRAHRKEAKQELLYRERLFKYMRARLSASRFRVIGPVDASRGRRKQTKGDACQWQSRHVVTELSVPVTRCVTPGISRIALK